MMEYINKRNPILPLKYHVPDGEAHMMPDGRLYVYGSYDALDMTYCSQKYHVVSTGDMEHWTVHGDVAFHAQDVPWMGDPQAKRYPGIDWTHPTPFLQKMIDAMPEEVKTAAVEAQKAEASKAQEGDGAECETQTAAAQMTDGFMQDRKQELLFAPDCLYRNGKYYLYFCMSDDSEGVAVSDRPEGPFKNPVQLPCGGIDPAVFIDDDGQAYYYWGQVFAHGVKLNDDMVSFNENEIVDDIVTEEEHCFHEGSSMRKIGDTYYYVYADMERGKPTSLGYSTGKNPLGPFTYRGIIIDNDGCDPQSWNNHGSIECVDGQWYVFYHRCSRGTQQYRRLCVEKITVNPDGTIDEVKMTSQGIGDPFAPGEKIMGYQACGLKGNCCIDVDNDYGYEEKLTRISDGDEAVFRYVKSEAAWKGIEITCTGGGVVSVFLNGEKAGEVHASCEKGTIQTMSAPINMDAGEYELLLRFEKPEELEVLSVTLF
ncbi:MAG TPA: family 43 glycosylhydrolase [Candidatus Blautia faecipullorum]|nr:family 43 glycosylhydrolase [Candidatus Blautia faecipullorum]